MLLRWIPVLFLPLLVATAHAEVRQVELIAHRGASHDAPENTVAAFNLAWEQQADGAECDLYLTKDGHIVGFHDKTAKRTAGVDKPITECTFAELRELDVGSWKNPRYHGEKIPSFQELISAVPAGKKIYIEIKSGPEIVPELLRQMKEHGKPVAETPIICFNAKVIAAVKEERPDLPAYFLHDPEKITAEELIQKAREIHADGVDLRANAKLDAEYARKILDAGLRLDVWTVNSPEEARRVAELGVQGITTDRPAFLREHLFSTSAP